MSQIKDLPGYTPVLGGLVEWLRAYIRDYPELNRLVLGVESSDTMMAMAILSAQDEFNGSPPILGNFTLQYLVENGQRTLLINMARVHLMQGLCELQTRNQLSYSSGGTSVSVNDKTPLLMKLITMLQPANDQMLLRVKTAWNVNGIMGTPGVGSEYAVIHTQLPL